MTAINTFSLFKIEDIMGELHEVYLKCLRNCGFLFSLVEKRYRTEVLLLMIKKS